MIAGFMNNRSARVKVGEEYSESFAIERRVPQGSKRGLLLYNIYTRDIEVPKTERSGMDQFVDDTL